MCIAEAVDIKAFVLALLIGQSIPALAYDPYDCLSDVAKIDPEITIGLATELCSGTWTQEPVECYRAAPKVDKDITRGVAVELCAGSVNAEKTLSCYAGSESRELNRGLATTLCSAKKSKN